MTQQRGSVSPTNVSTRTYDADTDTVTVGAPLDRIRWSSVLGGVLTFFASFVVLTVLGLAIGLSTFDANNPDDFAIGATIYGSLNAIISFFLGGFVAAKTTAVAGTGNGLLNGAMVWIASIALIVNFLGAGVGSLLGTAGSIAQTAVTSAADVAGSVADDAAAAIEANPEAVQDAAATAEAGIEAAVEDVQEAIADVDAQDINEATRDVSPAAWTALLALGLTAAASILGGILGKRNLPTDVAVMDRDRR